MARLPVTEDQRRKESNRHKREANFAGCRGLMVRTPHKMLATAPIKGV